MAKASFKDILLKKGEKIALGVCGGVFALLLFKGLSGGPAKSTPQMISELKSATDQVKALLKSETVENLKPLPAWVDQTGALRPVPSKDFLVSANAFEPVFWPSLRRENPKMLKPIDSQIDVFLLAIGARDRRFELGKDGVESLKLMGVLKQQVVKNDDFLALKKKYEDTTKDAKKKKTNQPPRQPALPPGGGGGRPGMGGGGPGMGGGYPGMGGPGGDGGEGSGVGMPGMGGYPGSLGSATAGRTEQIVEYVTPADWEKNRWREAETVHPTRLAIIQASFPLKAQLQEIQRALRLPNLAAAIQACTPGTGSGTTGLPGGTVGPGGPGGPGLPPGDPDERGPGGGRPGSGQPGMPGAGSNAGPGTLYTTSPEFLRLEVQRRRVGYDGKPLQVLGKDGKPEDGPWEMFDHQGLFFDAFLRYETPMYLEMPKKVEYVERVKEKDGERMIDQKVEYEIDPQLFLRMEQGLSAPLPRVADNMALDYPPPINLWHIHDNARRLAKLLENPQVKDQFKEQLKKKNNANPYSRGSLFGTQTGYGTGFGGSSDEGRGGQYGAPAMYGEGSGSPGGMPGYPGSGRPGSGYPGMPGSGYPGMPGGTPGTGLNANALADPNAIGAEFVLIRFLDPTLVPGESYKYRMRLVMKNPNFGKRELMATDTDADKLEIESPDDWFECPQVASLPAEFHLFAGSSKTYETSHADELATQMESVKDATRKAMATQAYQKFAEMKDVAEGKKAVVQLHWWLPQLILPGSSAQEPIGAWVTADVPVGPGEFIGRKALVPLPLWSSKTENYVMSSRKLQKAGIAGLKPEETPPGQIVNFTTPNLLVDFDGRKTPVATKDKDKEDLEVANELLVLRSDGTIEVLSEVQAAADKERTKRLDQWMKWVADAKKRKELGVPPGSGTPGSGGGRGDDR